MAGLQKSRLFLLVLIIGVLGMPLTCHGGQAKADAVYGRDIQDGCYEVRVESSSSMFRIVRAKLNIEDGNMTADITLSGTGYLKLFMGTGEEALAAGEEGFISYVEDEEGAYTYTIPVEALDVQFPCAAYSRRKGTWYDRELMIPSSSLPDGALGVRAGEGQKPAPAPLGKGDGQYTMEVSLKGGTGRASIVSPAHVDVSAGAVSVSVQWSSPDYDYMIAGGKKYFPVNSQGGSVFEIPVPPLEEEIDIIADTVAMSSPHEIEYTLVFHWDTMRKKGSSRMMAVILLFALAGAGVWGYVSRCRGKGKVRDV